MRPDIDACRDPDLLAAEVRRLRAVIAASQPTLTDEERVAVARVSDFLSGLSESDIAGDAKINLRRHAATLRSLLERLGDGK